MKAYFVCLMTNRSRVVLYTGMTNDLARRVWEHQNGTVKGFTKAYQLTILVYYETYNDIATRSRARKSSKHGVEAKRTRWSKYSTRSGSIFRQPFFQQMRDLSASFGESG